MKLDAARIFVDDLDAAWHFYAAVLGLPVKVDGRENGFCVFECGAVELVVEAVAADAPADDRALVGRFTGLSFSVPDAVETHRELVGQGVQFTGLPERQFWGGVLATLQDPSGNQLQICERPAAA